MKTVCTTLALVLLAAAMAPAGPLKGKGSTPLAREVPDLAKGPVDPYEMMGERSRFFKAAGVDNELDSKEFATARSQPDSFVRKFDRWELMLPHDKNSNGTIDWFEADAYRRRIRDAALNTYDENKDRRLTDEERQKLNALLNVGRLPGEVPPMGKSSGGKHPDGRRPDGHDNYKGMSEEERRARMQEEKHRREMEQQRQADEHTGQLREIEGKKAEADRIRQELLAKYDTDGDGKLSPQERAPLIADKQQAALLKRFDKDHDGQLDSAEQAALDAYEAEREANRQDKAQSKKPKKDKKH